MNLINSNSFAVFLVIRIRFFPYSNVYFIFVGIGAHLQRRSARLARLAFKLLGNEFPKSYARLIIGATNQTQRDASRRGALTAPQGRRA